MMADMPAEQFRGFVLKCFGATVEEQQAGIHGMKGAVPVWVGEANPKKAVTAMEVQDYANAIRKTLRYKQDNLRDGIMLARKVFPTGAPGVLAMTPTGGELNCNTGGTAAGGRTCS